MKLPIVIIAISLIVGSGLPVLAQDALVPTPEPAASPQPFAADVAGFCSDYFQPERLSVSVPGTLPEAQPGTPFTVNGSITNDNPVALGGVSLVVKVIKQQGEAPSHETDVVVDQFVAVENIGLALNRATPFSFTWNVPTAIEQGQYYFHYSLYLQSKTAIAGDSTSDTMTIGFTPVNIGGAETGSLVEFVKNQTTLAGAAYSFGETPTLGRNDVVAAAAVVSNPSQTEKTIVVQWLQYANHALADENIRYTQTEVVTIPAGETRALRYDVAGQLESKVHLIAKLTDGDYSQLLNLSFIRSDGFEVFTPFVGLTQFPLQSGQPVSLLTCTEAPYTTLLPDVTVEMKLLDVVGTVLSEYTQTSILLEDMNAFKKEFIPGGDLKAVTLQVRLLLGGGELQSYTIPFSCENFAPEVCGVAQVDEVVADPDETGFSRLQVMILTVGGILVIFFIGAIIRARRKKAPVAPPKIPLEDLPHYE